MSSQLTFLGSRSQDLSKCSSSRLWGKHNPFQSGGLRGSSHHPLDPTSFRLKDSLPHTQNPERSRFLEATQQCVHST